MLTIASLSIREAASRRVALIVAVLTLLGILASVWAFAGLSGGLQPREAVPGFQAGFTIFLAFAFSAGTGVAAAFLAAPAVAADLSSGIALAVLPRPLSRSDYVAGKWLGLGGLAVGYVAVSVGIEFLALRVAAGYAAPHPAVATLCLATETLVVATLALAFGTRLPAVGAGILAVALFGLAWLDGFVASIAQAVHNDALLAAARAIALALPSDLLWRGAVFALEPDAMVGPGAPPNPFLVQTSLGWPEAAWVAGWFVAVLALTMRGFAARDV
jgi:ABC-type transport system involved in multi-copper enzyme maturation permease subunit